MVLARFALRDGSLASGIIPILKRILEFKEINDSILEQIIIVMSDLCKRHTSLVDAVMKTIISQLHSPYLSVRKTALVNLNELIIQDFVKMRGRLLLNILTLITDEEMSTQAFYVIQLYAHSKNEKLLRTTIIECVYVFNNFLQYADSEMFPSTEFDSEPSILYGDQEVQVQKRRMVYDFFIHSIDDVHVLMILGNVNKIYNQLVRNKFYQCPEGADTLKDLIYIFTEICNKRAPSGKAAAKVTTESNEDEDGFNPSPKKKAKLDISAMAAASTSGGRRGNHVTMNDAMITVEKMIAVYQDFHQEVFKYSQFAANLENEFKDAFHAFSYAIAKAFKSIVEYAKPRDFWTKMLKEVDDKVKEKRSTKKRKSSGKDAEDDDEDEDDDDDEDLSDDDA